MAEVTVFNENTKLGGALLKGSDEQIVLDLIARLKKLGVFPKAVVEHGPGANAAPAITFLKNGFAYFGIETNDKLCSRFKEDLLPYLSNDPGRAHLFETNVVRLDLKKAIKSGHPLLVLFYNSLGYIPAYTPKLGKKSISYVLGRYADFLEQGDAMACIWTVYPHQNSLDAEDFYEILKQRDFKKIVLITVSRDALDAHKEVLVKRAYGKGATGAKAAMDDIVRLLDMRAEPNRYLILGVICIK